jgi:putative ABC transport system permease protein
MVQRIRSIEGVKCAEPYLVGHSIMTLPNGGFEDVLVVGCEPATMLGGSIPVLGTGADRLRLADGILVDEYETQKLGDPQIGDIREIGCRRARIVGLTRGIVGFLVTPYIFTTIDRAAGFLGRDSDDASYFLVQVDDGFAPHHVCRQIRERLPDLEAYTRNDYAAISIGYWLKRTGLGISFGAATVLGLIVGLIVVAQTLYASVLDRLVDFGALKAIGARESQVRAVILYQACGLAIAGSALGLICVMFIQQAFNTPRATIAIPWYVSLGSCLLVASVCLVASLLPYWRVRTIDPAVVLHS